MIASAIGGAGGVGVGLSVLVGDRSGVCDAVPLPCATPEAHPAISTPYAINADNQRRPSGCLDVRRGETGGGGPRLSERCPWCLGCRYGLFQFTVLRQW